MCMQSKTPTKKKSNKIMTMTAASLMPRTENELRVLHERANRMAKEQEKNIEADQVVSYVKFRLGEHETYGIAYHHIQEVMDKLIITQLPHVPNFVAGVINWRGILLSIIDLRVYFSIHTDSPTRNPFVIVVVGSSMTVGVMVDNIDGSDSYHPAVMTEPLTSKNSLKSSLVIGLHESTTTILNVEALLSDIQAALSK